MTRLATVSRCLRFLGLAQLLGLLANYAAVIAARAVGDIEWHQCPGIMDPLIECGTVVVPLDYFDPGAGIAVIALGKYKAQVSPSKGTVFLGAGGPGDLGQLIAIQAGKRFSSIRIGPGHDIVGFDHRVLQLNALSRGEKDTFYRNTVFELGYTQPPNVTEDPYARLDLILQYRQAIAMWETQAKLCTLNMPNNGSDLKYMGTSTVARDIDFMSKIIDGPDAPINFYGGSYGSVLGSYLVNMFPGRVGRVAIDGVADPTTWSGKHSYEWIDGWLSQIEDVYDNFVRACIQAGPSKCALATESATEDSLKNSISTLFDRLYVRPLPSPNSVSPAYLTSGAARASLYLGILGSSGWPGIAKRLRAAMDGDPAPIMNTLIPDLTRDVADKGDLYRQAVTCIDALPFDGASTGPTAEELADAAIARIKKVSPHFGISVTLSEPDGGCEFWPQKGVERFAGPWNHTLASPILIASTSEDPITPLASAQLVHRLLGNSSRLLIQRNSGHVTPSGVSTCTANVFLSYFSNGTVPADVTTCEVDMGPFGLDPHTNTTMEAVLGKKFGGAFYQT